MRTLVRLARTRPMGITPHQRGESLSTDTLPSSALQVGRAQNGERDQTRTAAAHCCWYSTSTPRCERRPSCNPNSTLLLTGLDIDSIS